MSLVSDLKRKAKAYLLRHAHDSHNIDVTKRPVGRERVLVLNG